MVELQIPSYDNKLNLLVMRITSEQIENTNQTYLQEHKLQFDFLCQQLVGQGIDPVNCLEKIQTFQVAIPSWALGAGGTRFGRFSMGGEPATLHDKIDDVGILHQLTQSAGTISLHIPWDIPKDPQATKDHAASYGILFDAVNSNTFQDQSTQTHSYKFGSLCHTDPSVRKQAVEHNQLVIDTGIALGSKSITVWLADGASFPGQLNFQKALQRTMESLQAIYAHLPEDWKMYIDTSLMNPIFIVP